VRFCTGMATRVVAIVSVQTGESNQIDEEVRRALIDGGEAGSTDLLPRSLTTLHRNRKLASNATRVGLRDAMRRLDASRCKPVASEAETERAPLRNEQTDNTVQGLVN
jgi:hypothetical protein